MTVFQLLDTLESQLTAIREERNRLVESLTEARSFVSQTLNQRDATGSPSVRHRSPGTRTVSRQTTTKKKVAAKNARKNIKPTVRGKSEESEEDENASRLGKRQALGMSLSKLRTTSAQLKTRQYPNRPSTSKTKAETAEGRLHASGV